MKIITTSIAGHISGGALEKFRFVNLSSGSLAYSANSWDAQYVTLEKVTGASEGCAVQEWGVAEVEFLAGTSTSAVYEVEVTTGGKVKKLDLTAKEEGEFYKYFELVESVVDSAANNETIVRVSLIPKYSICGAKMTAGETIPANRLLTVEDGDLMLADNMNEVFFATETGGANSAVITLVLNKESASVVYSAGTSTNTVFEVEATADGKVKELDTSGLQQGDVYYFYELLESIDDEAGNDGDLVEVVLKKKRGIVGADLVAGGTIVAKRFGKLHEGKVAYATTAYEAQFVIMNGADVDEPVLVKYLDSGLADVDYHSSSTNATIWKIQVTTDGKALLYTPAGADGVSNYFFNLENSIDDEAAAVGPVSIFLNKSTEIKTT